MSHPLWLNDGVMNKPLTEIVFILDRSGSMQALVEPAISGFELAGDFLPQLAGQVVGVVVGDAGCTEEEVGELGGGFPVEVLEGFEGGGCSHG